MKARIEYIKDVIGNNYIGVNIYTDIAYPYLNQLKVHLSDEYETYTKLQKERDNSHYHITVINVMEYNRLSKSMGVDKFINSLEKLLDMEFDINLMGLGKATKNENNAYFVVVNSNDLQEVRKKYELPEQDFHITLGFKWKDVFGIRKNKVIELRDPFIKLLKDEYYKNGETFDFVKSLPNYDGEEELEVKPIKIEDTYATFNIGDDKYYSVSLIGDNLIISAKWSDKEKKPLMANTLIYRKMKLL